MLRAEGLEFGYAAVPVIRGVSLDVPTRGFVGIIGPNGSGKSTLLRLLSGTLRPQRGSLTIDDVPFAGLSRAAIARRMAVVAQETQLAFEYSVLEVVLMGRYPHLGAFQIEGPGDLAIARRALDSTGTLALERRPFSTLSGGEKQRVIIAAALAQVDSDRPSAAVAGQAGSRRPESPSPHEGRWLLLDEPTTALDLKYQLETAALLRGLHARLSISIVVSTHDLNFAASVCQSLVLLHAGRVLASGPVDRVLTPDRIRELYDVEAEVARHPRTGHLIVVPVPGPSA